MEIIHINIRQLYILLFFVAFSHSFSTPSEASECVSYQVKRGETLGAILFKYFRGNSDLLISMNGKNTSFHAGQTICIPSNKFGTCIICTLGKLIFNITRRGLAFPSTVPTLNFLNKHSRYISIGFKYDAIIKVPNWNYPSRVDWVGVSQSVKNQGTCASCWAFAAIGAIEAAYAIKSGVRTTIDLSEKQLVDCLPKKCDGGWAYDALEYIGTNRGISPELIYPYIGLALPCLAISLLKPVWFNPEFAISMYEQVDVQDWLRLLLAVQQQPIIVNLNGGHNTFNEYVGGIYEDYDCSPYVVDHSLLVVGYDLSGDFPHWILKNSWGTSWGENGYMRMSIVGGLGICGIHSTPGLYPVMVDSNPCGLINPCGAGTCLYNSQTKKNSCVCPPTFVAVKNIDGSESCAPIRVCSLFAKNPCGVGTCVDDMKGSFRCICPRGFGIGKYIDGRITCVAGSLTNTYITGFGDTCYLIANQFGFTIQHLQTKNKALNCTNVVSGMPLVTTPPTGYKGCSISYSVNQNNTCNSIAAFFSLSLSTLLSLNPAINCAMIIPGQQVCVAPGPSTGELVCTSSQVVYPNDTCAEIIRVNNLTPTEFFHMNPGIYCDNLIPSNSTMPGTTVCVSANPPGACTCSTKRYYIVRDADSCPSIINRYYGASYAKFQSLNCNARCQTSDLYSNQRLCY